MKRSTLGIVLLAFPLPLLVFTMSAYAIFTFVLSSMAMANETADYALIGSIVSVLLGFLGVIATLGFFIGMPVGAYLLFTGSKEKKA